MIGAVREVSMTQLLWITLILGAVFLGLISVQLASLMDTPDNKLYFIGSMPNLSDARTCELRAGGIATYQGSEVAVTAEQGNEWYRIKNEYGETMSKHKDDLKCI